MFATYFSPGAAATGDASQVGLNGQNRVAEMTGAVIPNTLNMGALSGIPTGVAYNPYLSTPYHTTFPTYGQPIGFPTFPTVSPFAGVGAPVNPWNTVPTPYNHIPALTPFGAINPVHAMNPVNGTYGVNPFVAASPWGLTNPINALGAGIPATAFGVPFNPLNMGVSPLMNPAVLASTINPFTGIPTVFGQPLVNPLSIAPLNPFNSPINRINPFTGGFGITNPLVGCNPISSAYGMPVPATYGLPGTISGINPLSAVPAHPWINSLASPGLVNPAAFGTSPFASPIHALSTINPFSTIGTNPFSTGTPFGLNPFICAACGISPFCGVNPLNNLVNSHFATAPWSTPSWTNNPFVSSITNPFTNSIVNPIVSSLFNPFTGPIPNPFVNPLTNAGTGTNPWMFSALCNGSPFSALGVGNSGLNPGTSGTVPGAFGHPGYGWNGVPSPVFNGPAAATVNPFACGPTGCF